MYQTYSAFANHNKETNVSPPSSFNPTNYRGNLDVSSQMSAAIRSKPPVNINVNPNRVIKKLQAQIHKPVNSFDNNITSISNLSFHNTPAGSL